MSIPSQKDADQCIRYAFDDDTNRLRTDATFSGTLEVHLDQTNDSVAIGDGTTLFTGTTVSGKHGEDVNVIQSALPTGASTSAAQATGNSSLSSIDGKLSSLGQKAMAASVPVVIASDQSAVPVSAASLPLPSGAATAVNQAAANASLSSIDTKLTSPLAISAASLPLPAGAATAANQATANASLSSIDTKLTAPLAVTSKAATPTAGTLTQAAVAVGVAAVRATVSGSAPSATRSLLTITIDPSASANFYVGSSSVTSSGATRGLLLVGGQSMIVNQDAADYYIISDTAAQTVFVLEQA